MDFEEHPERWRPQFFARNTRVPMPYKPGRGHAPNAFDYHDILRNSEQKETGLYGRAGAPGNSANWSADSHSMRRYQRWDELRYTQRADPEFISFAGERNSLRVPVEHRSHLMQWTPRQMEIPNEQRRLTPYIERDIDTSMTEAYRSNPYVQPLPRAY
jgi:hypothetical protein